MLSIHIQDVADYPPEPVAETSAKPCRCRKAVAGDADSLDAAEDLASASPEDAGDTHVEGLVREEGEEDDDHGYKGPKPQKMTDDVNYNFHEKLSPISEKYNMYCDFLGNAAYCRLPWTCAGRIVKAKKKLDDIAERLEEQMTELELEVAKFSQCVSHNVWYDWYNGVDDMTGKYLREIFAHFKIST